MSLHIKEKKRNELFGRLEITATIDAEGSTPSRKNVLDLILSSTGANKDVVVINKIEHKFGHKTATISARVYDSSELRAKNELEYKIKRVKDAAVKPAQ